MTEQLTVNLSSLLEIDMIVRVVFQVILFVASAFFSGSETALFSLTRMDLRKLRRERSRYAEPLHALLDQPRRLIISVLCGNTLVNVAATANMTGILIAIYGTERAAWISTFLMVPLLLLFGEATPKTVAVSDPIGVSTRIVVRPMSMWVAVISPVTSIVRKVSERITTAIVGIERAPENILQVDEFRALVEEGVVKGELSATERALIYNLMRAGSAEVVEVMTPRTRVAYVNGSLPVPEVIEKFLKYRHKRIPVFELSRDNVIGFLHAEDILQLVLDKVDTSDIALNDIMHMPTMVPPTKKIDEMFDYFQNNDTQAACVLNEFGGIDGFITMADILTYIFGQPQGELPVPGIVYDSDDNAYEVPGEMKLNDFNKLTNFGIEDSRMTTIGGVVFRHIDRIPMADDEVILNGVMFTVSETEGNRISRLRASQQRKVEDAKHAGITEDNPKSATSDTRSIKQTRNNADES